MKTPEYMKSLFGCLIKSAQLSLKLSLEDLVEAADWVLADLAWLLELRQTLEKWPDLPQAEQV